LENKEKKNQNKLYKLYKFLKSSCKILCVQIIIIFILTLLCCKFYNYSDTLIYFSFGAFISVLLNASILLIKKYKICTSIEFNKIHYNFLVNYFNNYTNFNEENICKIINIIGLTWHLLFPLIALYYIKDYIKDSIKTEYAYIKAFIISIIYFLINVYIIGSFKVYNKSLELTKTEFNIIITSIILTYIALLYYFENIKKL
tara:strand:- start:56 stop:658 length:603 start_codon:yes stop_codon:yes gene_type:complete